MAKKRSYFWAWHFERSDPEIRALSREAMDGWEYAKSLTRNARERRRAALDGGLIPAAMTPTALAGYGITTHDVTAAISRARIELFGKDLSDSALAYRLKRRRAQAGVCAEPGCTNPIPRLAHAKQRYCSGHGTGSARVARHRRNRASLQA